ncbi:hypothetical protein QMK19_14250 [Streptomyces sp. H10-C2]|uniref:hypothetical protein n=1 Tax=unclassified Streptomyces TaxID=2593676 RepID=UPI0024BA911F|nr:MULTISPECIES: hypothetical protein [unclassified Streptomyces]MDJ0345033.1 hypothetical protein [Streptomyces sp. PH10-H1]MDJ0370810.1 hypothetical protein [Streptomyces sp. H10-C2]
MRLVFVHGRGQEVSSEEEQKAAWMKALKEGCEAAWVELPDPLDVRVPFYGKILDEEIKATPGTALTRGADDPFDSFEAQLLEDIADRADITEGDVLAELAGDSQVLERGVKDSRYVLALGRVLARRFPFIGDEFIRQFTPDVHAYLLWEGIRNKINQLVVDDLGNGPTVVVGHSLGSVVAYWALTKPRPSTTVPLLVTLGSPLGLSSIKRHLPRPLARPHGVRHWLNASDVRDPVALFPRLERDHFPAKVENLSDIQNPRENRHGIAGYLADPFVAERIAQAVSPP